MRLLVTGRKKLMQALRGIIDLLGDWNWRKKKRLAITVTQGRSYVLVPNIQVYVVRIR